MPPLSCSPRMLHSSEIVNAKKGEFQVGVVDMKSPVRSTKSTGQVQALSKQSAVGPQRRRKWLCLGQAFYCNAPPANLVMRDRRRVFRMEHPRSPGIGSPATLAQAISPERLTTIRFSRKSS